MHHDYSLQDHDAARDPGGARPGSPAWLLGQARGALHHLWSIERFPSPGLEGYARRLMLEETRRGVVTASLVSLVLLVASTVLYGFLGLAPGYAYTSALLALLSMHVYFSARACGEIRVLRLLGMTLLVVSGTALVLLAHQVGGFDPTLYTSVVLLFMMVPLVPWGLKEAGTIAVLLYFIFTLSTVSVHGRFSPETLVLLQFLMLGGGLTTLTVVARHARIRRHDIRARYDLEDARRQMEHLSFQDSLTGAWNRRFLETRLPEISRSLLTDSGPYYFALFDLDHFKALNDRRGHAFGDAALRAVAAGFMAILEDDEYLVRMGGDEFALVLRGATVNDRLTLALARARRYLREASSGTEAEVITVSVGLVRVTETGLVDLERMYRAADAALYQAKHAGRDRVVQQELA